MLTTTTLATITLVLVGAFIAAVALWLFALDRRLSAAEDLAASLDRDLDAVEQLAERLLEERAALAEADAQTAA